MKISYSNDKSYLIFWVVPLKLTNICIFWDFYKKEYIVTKFRTHYLIGNETKLS